LLHSSSGLIAEDKDLLGYVIGVLDVYIAPKKSYTPDHSQCQDHINDHWHWKLAKY